MRAPRAAPGMMVLEIAIDEMAEKLRLDPVEFRIRDDTQLDPEKPEKRFSGPSWCVVSATARRSSGGADAQCDPPSGAMAAGWSVWVYPRPSTTTRR